MKMWIAKQKTGTLSLFQDKPYLDTVGLWFNDNSASYKIPAAKFPEVTFENSPQEVELVIKK